MYTTQSKMISRAIWVEKKHVWKINLQKNGVRKSFYSSVPGDKGRKICAQNATSWLSGACPFSVSERTTVDTVFERYLQDKALETTNMPRNPALPRIHRNPAAAPSGNTRGRQHYTTLTAYRDGTRRHPPPSAVSGDTTLKGEIP